MNEQRLSLSSSVFAGRVKKFDTYQHNPAVSQRIVNNIHSHRNSVRISNTSPGSKHSSISTIKSSYLKPAPIKKSSNSLNALTPKSHSKNTSTISENSTINLALSVIAKSSARNENNIEVQFSDYKAYLPKVIKKHSRLHMAFYGLGVLVFLFAGFASFQTVMTNRSAKQQLGVLGDKDWSIDEQGVAEGTSTDPAETEVTAQAIANYKVDPELPRYLKIPKLGINARIKHTGIDRSGAVDSPKNINDISWYNESARPGNAIGSSLLMGHVSGWTSAGIFKKLDQLNPGDRFEIEKGSGEKLAYEVTKGERIPLSQVDMTKILGTEVAGEHDMKLMTCSGKYNKETKQFEERYVVYAKILR